MRKLLAINIPFRNLVYFSLSVNLVVIALVLFLKESLPPEVPLLYGLVEGETQLAPKLALAVPSLVSLGVLILNCGLSFFIKEDFLKNVLVLSGVLATFFSTITVMRIIFLVGSIGYF